MFVSAQFGQGWVVEVVAALEPVPDVTGAELEPEGPSESGVEDATIEDATIGAPHVSQ
ncbi:MAG: hypothetical protein ACYDC9_08325 [Dermatophilaceae bacterium]